MPLSDEYTKAVMFVLGWRLDGDGARVLTPIGTAFLVSVPSSTPGRTFAYAVTAAHVVRSEVETFLRLNKIGSGTVDDPADTEDLQVAEWLLHEQGDVAITPAGLPPGFAARHVPEAQFLDQWDKRPQLGDRVYFIGLLHQIAAMTKANIPMVRSGTLGRMYQEGIPVRAPDGTDLREWGHLIDCRAYQGFSGSPCFVQCEVDRYQAEPPMPGGMIGWVQSTETLLLGLIGAHFDSWQPARELDPDAGRYVTSEVQAPIHTGVGVVIPVERISDLLHHEDVVARRRAIDERYKDETGDKPATADSIPRDEQAAGVTREAFFKDNR